MAYADTDKANIGVTAPSLAAPSPPQSAVPLRDGLTGMVGLVLAWLIVLAFKLPPIVAGWLILPATALPMLAAELRRGPKPAPLSRDPGSPLHWLVGFVLASLPFLAIHAQGMGIVFWGVAWCVALPALVLRFVLEARRNGALRGGFPLALGRTLLLDRKALARLLPAARLWALKGFFIPLYALSLYGLVGLAQSADLLSPIGVLTLFVVFAYTVDLSFGLSGYVFASNDLVATIRSTQPLVLGWVVCLLCYGPVYTHWPAFEKVVRTEIGWPALITDSPLVLAGGVAMLALLMLYASASVCFGLRFSNLSNRGVVTTGPYRWMKHPAYFAHAVNSWIICLIFLPAAGLDLGIGQLLVPAAFTILYRLRAVTEERHMSEDEAYVDYARWIAAHGVLAQIRRFIRLR